MRSRSNVSIGSPALAMLREEDEDVSSAERPQKKRRLESRTTADAPTTPKFDLARRITRSQANRIGPILTDVQSPIQKTRILRTRSQKLPERKPLYESAHANITTVRGAVDNKRKAQTAPSANRAVLAPEMVISRRKKPADGKATARAVSMEASEVTFGIDGLTITAATADSCSDMDISLD
ncbi:hypothetical protein A0H81_01681 [Grifola frondosa]|uniref:Uncharacterized protein n=1 Tax=Grifola frondosa TaxID=5627 RepID=A0A1C7MN88_GRIFR|nr:hypothetical protein A0H81_01681 [Grifola frondosa]